MNEEKIIMSKFQFLEDNGFESRVVKLSHTCFRIEYRKNDLLLFANYDIRDEDFSITVQRHDEFKLNRIPQNLFDLLIIPDQEIKKVMQVVETINSQKKMQFRGISKEQLEETVLQYANIVESNMNTIFDRLQQG